MGVMIIFSVVTKWRILSANVTLAEYLQSLNHVVLNKSARHRY